MQTFHTTTHNLKPNVIQKCGSGFVIQWQIDLGAKPQEDSRCAASVATQAGGEILDILQTEPK